MAQSLPSPLPPVEHMRAFSSMLDPGVPRTVLDAGCGEGRHSLLLARFGHFVTGISDKAEDIITARAYADQQGISDHCNFLVGDIRDLTSMGMFDIVLANEVLQEFPPTVRHRVLASLRQHTKQGGLNIVSGYVVRPGTANATNTDRSFAPEELREEFEAAGWIALDYDETYHPNQRLRSGREAIFSTARIIAQRPWAASIADIPAQRGRG